MSHTFGWNPDRGDMRDAWYEPKLSTVLPSSVDLRSLCPPVYDQGQLGSCTANAIAGAIEFDQLKQGITESTPSRLFIYYNERVIEHSVSSDAGAAIRDGIKTIHKQGACYETLWPYDIMRFDEKPPQTAYKGAKMHLVTGYKRIAHDLFDMQIALASGYPFVFGFTVYQSFEYPEVANTGVVPMPRATESVLGGHAVMAVGYDNTSNRFLCRNSWGASWGMQGYFTMPYAYLTDMQLAQDFWTINATT